MEQDFMRAAVEAAQGGVSRQEGGPFGAVIVRNGQILSSACNRVIREQDPTAHAEVNAIREACRLLGRFHLEDCDLYTSCEPCPMCLGAIYWSKLRSVCYAATRDDAARAGFSDAQIAHLTGKKEEDVSASRRALKLSPDFKLVDTCAAEFRAHTPYYYSTYDKAP